MTERPRTPRAGVRRRNRRRHHSDRAFRGVPLIELTVEEVMLDLDPGWPATPRPGDPT